MKLEDTTVDLQMEIVPEGETYKAQAVIVASAARWKVSIPMGWESASTHEEATAKAMQRVKAQWRNLLSDTCFHDNLGYNADLVMEEDGKVYDVRWRECPDCFYATGEKRTFLGMESELWPDDTPEHEDEPDPNPYRERGLRSSDF